MSSPEKALSFGGLSKPSVFKKDGTVTAGNASGINDGAAAVVVMRIADKLRIGSSSHCAHSFV